MRNRIEIVSEWSDFSFLIISSLDEKESENLKCCKLVENHPINQFWHENSIEKCFQNDRTSLSCSSDPLMKKSPKIENVPNWSKIILYTNFDMRNRLVMVWEWSDFSLLIIGSLDEKESENRECSKLVENHPINQFWHEKLIGNGFRMIRLFFVDHRLPWWIRVRKSKIQLFLGNAGYTLLVD